MKNFFNKNCGNFFKTIGINERKNKKVQINFMPKKYWEYIIEMEDEK